MSHTSPAPEPHLGNGPLAGFKAALEALADRHLARYTTENLPLIDLSPFGKEFNDPIWQTIKVRPLELLLIDSPLFQRLRSLKQLGVAHWVYPGATHTRFEHTLGVLSRVQALVDGINHSQPDEEHPAISPKETGLLRLAALCHDLGHGFMSHVSENALAGLPPIDELRQAFLDQTGVEKVQLSEIAAYYLVGSQSFRRLLRAVQEHAGTSYDYRDNDLIESVQNTIIGKPISIRIPLLHELISGPFDADKLDYMTRDARMAGVPVVTDIPRMTQKIRAVEISKETLQDADLGKLISGNESSYLITGIALSGGRALDELMFGRALLFDKIYRHQKVRAVEGMVASLIYNLAELLPGREVELPYLFNDDEVLSLNASLVQKKLRLQDAEDDNVTAQRKNAIDIACDLSDRLRERRLFVRAFAFAVNTPQNAFRQSKAYRRGLDRIIRESQTNHSRQRLSEAVAQETCQMLKKLGKNADTFFPTDPTLMSYIWIDPPKSPGSAAQVSRALLITEDKKVIRFRDDSAEMRGWSDAYLQTNDIGYVFCALELRVYVHLATEKVFLEKYGVQMDPIIFNYAKQQEKDVDKVRTDLAAAGYYKNSPRALWPIPRRLLFGDVKSICGKVYDQLRGYEEPGLIEDAEDDSEPLNALRITQWVRQFQADGLISFALDVLSKIRLIGRRDCSTTIASFIDQNPEFRGAAVCSLGSAKDSGAITAYYAADVPEGYETKVLDLDAALDSSRPLIFLDDIVGSGRQYVNTLCERLGQKTQFDLGETPHPSLTEARQRRLRGENIAFLFSVGLDDGVKLLKEESAKLGLQAKVYAQIPQSELPTIHDQDLKKKHAANYEKCVDVLRQIGRSVLTDPAKPSHNEEWREGRALGYGNRGLLIVFPYNTPAQTLTCLWEDGKFEEAPWIPLVPRRQKQ